MTFLPLFGPAVDCGFARDVHLVKDVSYGELVLGTSRSPGAIAPWGMIFVVPGAQDRALREPAYCVAFAEERVDAVCVEPAQAGLWQDQEVEVSQLPPSLLAALPARGGGYSALWPSMRQRARTAGVKEERVAGLLEGRRARLVPPREARGGLVTLDGRPIALVLAPDPGAFRDWWFLQGLGRSLDFEALSYPPLPLPLGQLEIDLCLGSEGLFALEFGPFEGWGFILDGEFAYIHVVDSEAMTQFQREARQESSLPNGQGGDQTGGWSAEARRDKRFPLG